MHLIGTPRSRTMRVAWMLEELGLDYDWQPSLPRSPEVKALNPSGKIPVFKIGADVLTDSVAILQYLADSHNCLTHKAGTIPRAIQDSFTQFCIVEVEGPLWTAARHSLMYDETTRLPAIKPVCRMEFDQAMETLAQRLGDNDYVMGQAFTVPDLLLGHCAAWAELAKFTLPGGRVGAYFKRVRGRPAFKAALARAATLANAA
ncbi:MAG TPA: glutathione S-transferase family protein [Paracoccaceae bacterium]|nr:glutathione S-transferase family protein [Paracoccaceae bacterium]